MSRRTVLAAVAIAATITAGGMAASAATAPSEVAVFGRSPDDPSVPEPKYVAVSDGRGGIAGYVESALFNEVPRSPDEAKRISGVPRVFRVFDASGRHVGYWADEQGFVQEARKQELIASGYRYLEGSTPPKR